VFEILLSRNLVSRDGLICFFWTQAEVPVLKNVDLNPKGMDALMACIVDTAFEEGQDIFKSEENGKPNLYIVREGIVTISSTDNDGGVFKKEASAGEVFGQEELAPEGVSHFPSHLRRAGITAISTGGERTCICGVLSLNELENAQGIKEEKEGHQVLVQHSAVLQRREEVRISVRSNTKLEDLERISLLGEGQFGEVWLVAADVIQTGVNQNFALKSQ
jgi:hypothetical protein